MATVLTGRARAAARLAEADPASLVVWIGEARGPTAPAGPFAAIRVAARDPGLAAAMTAAMTEATRAAAGVPRPSLRSVRVRSRRAMERLGAERLAGAVAVVPVSARNLGALVDALRGGGAAGVQLVWDDALPRARAEARVFAVLERARATPRLPPVVLGGAVDVLETLRILVGARVGNGNGNGNGKGEA
jgi:hypothetical protein